MTVTRDGNVPVYFSCASGNAVAPVYLKTISRIQGLLAAYSFALLVRTLLGRELRQALALAGEASLPLYPEGGPCARPTTHRLIEVFSSIPRDEVRVGDGGPQVMVTQLTKVQRSNVRLLGLDPRTYGLARPLDRPPAKMRGNWNDDQRKGGYMVDFPDLPDIITSGSALAEAFANACEALDLPLEGLEKLGL